MSTGNGAIVSDYAPVNYRQIRDFAALVWRRRNRGISATFRQIAAAINLSLSGPLARVAPRFGERKALGKTLGFRGVR